MDIEFINKNFKVFITIIFSVLCITLPFIILYCIKWYNETDSDNDKCENSLPLIVTRIIIFFVIFYIIVKEILKDKFSEIFSFLKFFNININDINKLVEKLNSNEEKSEKYVTNFVDLILNDSGKNKGKYIYTYICILLILIMGIILARLSTSNISTSYNLINSLILIILIIIINYLFTTLPKLITISIILIPLFLYTTSCFKPANSFTNIFSIVLYSLLLIFFGGITLVPKLLDQLGIIPNSQETIDTFIRDSGIFISFSKKSLWKKLITTKSSQPTSKREQRVSD